MLTSVNRISRASGLELSAPTKVVASQEPDGSAPLRLWQQIDEAIEESAPHRRASAGAATHVPAARLRISRASSAGATRSASGESMPGPHPHESQLCAHCVFMNPGLRSHCPANVQFGHCWCLSTHWGWAGKAVWN